jgi:hypothetical protein
MKSAIIKVAAVAAFTMLAGCQDLNSAHIVSNNRWFLNADRCKEFG